MSLKLNLKDSLQALYPSAPQPEPQPQAPLVLPGLPEDVTRAKPKSTKVKRSGAVFRDQFHIGIILTRSLECSAGLRIYSFDCSPDWLISVFLPTSFSVFLSSPLHPPPRSSLPFLHICMLIMGESFLTFGQVWVQVWHQCCTQNFSNLFCVLFRSIVEIFWKHWKSWSLYFLLAQIFFFSKLSVTSNASFFTKLTHTNFTLGWKKWKHRVFKHSKVSRTAWKIVYELTRTQHHWSTTCHLPKEEQSNPDRVHFKTKKEEVI